MPQPLEYNEARGGVEDHLAVMKNRLDSAQADYDRAASKGIPAQVEAARKTLEDRQRDYDEFSRGLSGDSRDDENKEAKAATVH